MSDPTRIAVAMSGGVDSSVAAGLLREAGYDIFGLMLRLQDESKGPPNRCCAPSDVAAARSVAAMLGIPFYVTDARQAFEDLVILPFVRGYAQGLTPNPCIECNRTIRFGLLLEHALALGATHLATGHYARAGSHGPSRRLLVACDQAKDQSYVLHVLTQRQLAHVLFPLGELTKEEVRGHGRRMHLPVADRPESQDLCFVQGDYRAFLAARGIGLVPGPILNGEGKVIGTHAGLVSYTLGQRKGLGIPASEALYVIDKDVTRNALIVGGRSAIGRQQFSVSRITWIAGDPPADQFDASVQVRYHAPRAVGQVKCTSPIAAHVLLAEREPDVAPGQSAVFYLDDLCLGGGIISL
jgi:tRNA-uridine 2-sulfurtransferase